MSNNGTINNNGTFEPASTTMRLFGAISYALLSSCSLAMNLLLASVLLRGWHRFRQNPFFHLVWQLIFADLFAQILQLLIAVPTTFAGQKLFPDSILMDIFMQFDSISFHASMYFSLLMTLNRLTVFFCDPLNHFLFGPHKIGFSIAALWLFILAFVCGYAVSGCKKVFSETGFYMANKCAANPRLSWLNALLRAWAYWASTILPLLMLLAYFGIFLRIRYSSNPLKNEAISAQEKERKKREKNFLMQAFLICGFLEFQDLAFIFVPKIPVIGQWNYLLTFVVNWSGILLNSLSPLILFTFNGEVRHGLNKILGIVSSKWQSSTDGIVRVKPATTAIQQGGSVVVQGGGKSSKK